MIELESDMDPEIYGEFRPDAPREFATPWAARAFGLVLAGFERKLFTVSEFQKALIVRVDLHERERGPIDNDETYYSCWIEALESLLVSREVIGQTQLATAQAAVHSRLLELEHEHAHHHDHARPSPVPVYREQGQ